MSNHTLARMPSASTLPLTLKNLRVVRGAGRGHVIGFPTINLALNEHIQGLIHGVYAGTIIMEGMEIAAAIHYGPRPTFHDTESLEVHVIDREIRTVPTSVHLVLHKRIREIMTFSNVVELQQRIQRDIATIRAILAS